MLYDSSSLGTTLINKGDFYSSNTSFGDSEIKSRICYASAVPFCLVRGALESLQGIFDGVIAVATLGLFNNVDKHKNFNERAIRNLDPLKHLLTRPYACILKILNPKTQISMTIFNSDREYNEKKQESLNTLRYSRNFFDRHIKIRLKITVDTVIRAIIDVSNLVFGLIAAAFSIFPMLGRNDYLNDAALKKLENPLIQNLFHNLLLLINPWAIDDNPSYQYQYQQQQSP